MVVEVDGEGRSRLVGLRSEGPLVLRPTAPSPPCGVVVHLVGGAGGPLGGDALTVEVVVGPGAELTVLTVAAAVVLPGPAPSVYEIDARVGAGGRLRWMPEPTVAAAGCRHRTRARVNLDSGAGLVWREELVGGRHGEDGGSVSSRLSVDLGGRALVRHRLEMGPEHPAWASPAVGAGARCAGSLLVVDPAWVDRPPGPVVLDGIAGGVAGGIAAVMPLVGPAVQVVGLASDAITLRRLLEAGEAALGCRVPVRAA